MERVTSPAPSRSLLLAGALAAVFGLLLSAAAGAALLVDAGRALDFARSLQPDARLHALIAATAAAGVLQWYVLRRVLLAHYERERLALPLMCLAALMALGAIGALVLMYSFEAAADVLEGGFWGLVGSLGILLLLPIVSAVPAVALGVSLQGLPQPRPHGLQGFAIWVAVGGVIDLLSLDVLWLLTSVPWQVLYLRLCLGLLRAHPAGARGAATLVGAVGAAGLVVLAWVGWQVARPEPVGGTVQAERVTPLPLTLAGDIAAMHWSDSQRGWVLTRSGWLRHTRDGGSTWQYAAQPLPRGLEVLRFDSAGERGIAADDSTVLLTRDGGTTWQETSTATLLGPLVSGYVGSASWAITPDMSVVYLSTYGDGVFRSLDGGERFERLEPVERAVTVTHLALDARQNLYVLTDEDLGEDPSGESQSRHEILRSGDRGASWTRLCEVGADERFEWPLPLQCTPPPADPDDELTSYGRLGEALLAGSAGDDALWAQARAEYPDDFVDRPGAGEWFLSYRAVAERSGGAIRWYYRGLPGDLGGVALDPRRGEWWTASGCELYRSSARGWDDAPPPPGCVHAVHWSGARGELLLLTDTGVFARVGEAYEQRAAWQDDEAGSLPLAFAGHGERVWLEGEGGSLWHGAAGMLWSRDGGATWQRQVVPDADTAFMACPDDCRLLADGRVLLGGPPWAELHRFFADGADDGIAALAFVDAQVGIAATGGAAFLTTDGGRAWSRQAVRGDISIIVPDPGAAGSHWLFGSFRHALGAMHGPDGWSRLALIPGAEDDATVTAEPLTACRSADGARGLVETSHGHFLTLDGGRSWRAVDGLLRDARCTIDGPGFWLFTGEAYQAFNLP